MKIVVGRAPGEVAIYADDGRDITADLHCSEISVFVDNHGATATITCEHVDLIADLDYDNLVAQVRVIATRN